MDKSRQHTFVEFDQRDASPTGTRVEPPYFFGAYNQWQKLAGDPFATDAWIDHCQEMIKVFESRSPKAVAKKILEVLRQTPSIPKYLGPVYEHASAMLKTKEAVSIIDIGGGFGDNYFHISRALGALNQSLEYTVIDNQVQCQLGRKYYSGKSSNIKFEESIDYSKTFSIATIIGTLQYIEDWRQFLSQIRGLKCERVFVSRTPLVNGCPTFTTVQSICPALGSHALRKVGESNVNVLNEKELDAVMADSGYDLISSTFNMDYSSNFKRLPSSFHDVAYIDKHYARRLA